MKRARCSSFSRDRRSRTNAVTSDLKSEALARTSSSVSTAERLTLAFGSNWGAASNVVRGDRCSSLAGPRATSAETPARYERSRNRTSRVRWGTLTVPTRVQIERPRWAMLILGLAHRATPARACHTGFAATASGVATWGGASELAKRPALTLRSMGAFQTADAAVVLFAVLCRPISAPGPAQIAATLRALSALPCRHSGSPGAERPSGSHTTALYRGLPVSVIGRVDAALMAIAGYATPHERALGLIKATLGRSGQRYHVAGQPEEFATLGEAAARASHSCARPRIAAARSSGRASSPPAAFAQQCSRRFKCGGSGADDRIKVHHVYLVDILDQDALPWHHEALMEAMKR